jgi:hypothetical protein
MDHRNTGPTQAPPLSQVALDLQAAFGQPSCCICTLLTRDEHHYFVALLYEQVNNPGLRAAVRAARGYCVAHLHAFATTPNAPMGGALLAYDVLNSLTEDLPEQIAGRTAHAWDLLRAVRHGIRGAHTAPTLADQLCGTSACPACRHLNDLADMYAETLVASLARDDVGTAFCQSSGLCLPHVLLALRRGGSVTGCTRLVAQQRRVWQDLQQDLGEFIRKHDYRFRHEPMTIQQEESWRRAMQALSGGRGGHDEHDAHA